MTPKTILLTGGAGFIGSHFVRQLVNKTTHSVVNVDKLTYAGNIRSLIDLTGHPQYQFEQVDIVNRFEVNRLFQEHQPDWVIHLAAESHVDRSIVEPDAFIQTNIVGTYHLLQQALLYFNQLALNRKNEFRFLHVSTDEVYGSLLKDDPPFEETTPYAPRSPYSASKAASDHLARSWHTTYGLPVLVTHCSNNYGPFQHPEKLIPVVILNALAGKKIPVYGNGENIRDWLYVEDHIEALHSVIASGQIGETYDIGSNCELSNIELVQMVCQILDHVRPVTKNENLSSIEIQNYCQLISWVADRPGHDLRYAIQSAKIKQQLGWSPKESLATGLKRTVDWYLSNLDWCQFMLDHTNKSLTQSKNASVTTGNDSPRWRKEES